MPASPDKATTMPAAPLAALAAVWCTPSSASGEEPPPPPPQDAPAAAPAAAAAAAAAASHHPPPSLRQRHPAKAGDGPKQQQQQQQDAPGPLPSRRRVDGDDTPPLTPAESLLVAVFLTVWCGAPYCLALLGLSSLCALVLGGPPFKPLALSGWLLFALCFATLRMPSKPRTPWPACRNSRWLSLVRRYFDYSVAFERPLDPRKNYLFSSYPHGAYPAAQLLGLSCFQASGWRGDKFYGGAATSVFACPLWHHGMRWLGCVSADRATLLRLLRDEKASVGICPGGIAEMFLCATSSSLALAGGNGGDAGARSPSPSPSTSAAPTFASLRRAAAAATLAKKPGQSSQQQDERAMLLEQDERIILLERKGFVALAIESGVDLVPVFYFGNSALLSFGPAWLERLGRKLRVSLGLLIGAWGLPCPRRIPLMQAIGRPVPVPRFAEDGVTRLKRGTPEFERAVERVHAQFRRELERTFETFKPVYHKGMVFGGGGAEGGGERWARRRLIVH
jgi:hypothetical protein